MVPNLELHWYEIYGKVAMTGEAIRFQNGSEPMQRWFDVFAFRVGRPDECKVALRFKLGLAISHDLARGIGGGLTASSELAAGRTFTLMLPLA